MQGKIIKGIGGFYYVKTTDGDLYECRARGKFRNVDLKPQIGDNVSIEPTDEEYKGYVTAIETRKNSFVRPPISNIDGMIIVASLNNPAPDTMFIDKMLVICEKCNIDAAVCFNKSDLADNEFKESIVKTYDDIGYKTIVTCTLTGEGTDEIKNFLCEKTTAFAGFSGVGKSSLLNCILGSYNMQTGDVSKKLKRGKHTTRHVELFCTESGGDNTYIADTPGFSMLELPDDIKADNLKSYFKEFAKYEDNCKFGDCMHTSPKFCGVYDAVLQGSISQSRYENYKAIYNELKNKKEWQ